MTNTKKLRELLAKATPPKEWQDGGDGILFGHSADDSGVWHAGDSTLACALVNAAPALLDDLDAAQKRIAELEESLSEYRASARNCRCGAMGDALAKETT